MNYDTDLTGYTDAELSMVVFNTAEYYNCMFDCGLSVLASKLRVDSVEYTDDQWAMLDRDYQAEFQELGLTKWYKGNA
mgnify:CR=1 FL=1